MNGLENVLSKIEFKNTYLFAAVMLWCIFQLVDIIAAIAACRCYHVRMVPMQKIAAVTPHKFDWSFCAIYAIICCSETVWDAFHFLIFLFRMKFKL